MCGECEVTWDGQEGENKGRGYPRRGVRQEGSKAGRKQGRKAGKYRRVSLVAIGDVSEELHHGVAVQHGVLPVKPRLAVLTDDDVPLVHPAVAECVVHTVKDVELHLLSAEARHGV